MLAENGASRWGDVGLPLTSGPVSFFLALEYGNDFAASATAGSLVATISQASFAVVYYRLARYGWLTALLAATAVFTVVAVSLQLSGIIQTERFLLALPVMAVSLKLMPRPAVGKSSLTSPRWDILLRMMPIALLVTGVTVAAPWLGAGASGVIASFPFMAAILAVFSHAMTGYGAAQRVIRGLVGGLLRFVVFFWILSVMLNTFSLTLTYSSTMIAALGIQFMLLQRLRRQENKAQVSH